MFLVFKMNFYIFLLTLISIIAFKIYQSIRVPEGLKNVPTLSFLDLLIAIFTKAGPDKRWEATRETLEKEGIGKVILCDLSFSNKEKIFKKI
jgi:hypothetical protein